MTHIPKVMNAFARLLGYPDQHTAQAAELLYVILKDAIPTAASDVLRFGTFLEQHEPWQIEEAFTGTFDVNPTCALEVGWHLFGEEYTRGMFLVRMREELRKYNLPESAELTDHITHVLAVVSAMSDDDAAKFVGACVQPAVEKMNDALAQKDTPYRHVISGLATVIKQKWGAANSSAQPRVLESSAPQMDPLHAFPVAEVDCGGGCSGSCSEPGMVTVDTDFSAAHRPRRVSTENRHE